MADRTFFIHGHHQPRDEFLCQVEVALRLEFDFRRHTADSRLHCAGEFAQRDLAVDTFQRPVNFVLGDCFHAKQTRESSIRHWPRRFPLDRLFRHQCREHHAVALRIDQFQFFARERAGGGKQRGLLVGGMDRDQSAILAKFVRKGSVAHLNVGFRVPVVAERREIRKLFVRTGQTFVVTQVGVHSQRNLFYSFAICVEFQFALNCDGDFDLTERESIGIGAKIERFGRERGGRLKKCGGSRDRYQAAKLTS